MYEPLPPSLLIIKALFGYCHDSVASPCPAFLRIPNSHLNRLCSMVVHSLLSSQSRPIVSIFALPFMPGIDEAHFNEVDDNMSKLVFILLAIQSLLSQLLIHLLLLNLHIGQRATKWPAECGWCGVHRSVLDTSTQRRRSGDVLKKLTSLFRVSGKCRGALLLHWASDRIIIG